MSNDALRRRVAELVSSASQGAARTDDALAGETPLHDLRLDSLGLLRLVDALELEYGVEIDLTDSRVRLDTVDAIVASLERSGSTP
jgi:acyl carrier protein